jgi:hypothetical protein
MVPAIVNPKTGTTMALIKCKECGNEISNLSSKPCPYCGTPAARQNPILAAYGVAGLIALFVWVSGMI